MRVKVLILIILKLKCLEIELLVTCPTALKGAKTVAKSHIKISYHLRKGLEKSYHPY